VTEITHSNENSRDNETAVAPADDFPRFLMMDLDLRISRIQEMTRLVLGSPIGYEDYCEHLVDHLTEISNSICGYADVLDRWVHFLTDGDIPTWGTQLGEKCTRLLAVASMLPEGSDCAPFRSECEAIVAGLEVSKAQTTWCNIRWAWWDKWERPHEADSAPVPETIVDLIAKCENGLQDLRENGEMYSWAPTQVREIWTLAMQLGSPLIKMPAIADENENRLIRERYGDKFDRPIWTSSQINEFALFVTSVLEWCHVSINVSSSIESTPAKTNLELPESGQAGQGPAATFSDEDSTEDAANRELSAWIHEPGELPPPDFCIDRDPNRPCGPVVGNKTELGSVVHPENRDPRQLRRQLEFVATGRIPKVWIRQVNGVIYEAFFRSKAAADRAKKDLEEYRLSRDKPPRRTRADIDGHPRTSTDAS
jgi:hypothetical protein